MTYQRKRSARIRHFQHLESRNLLTSYISGGLRFFFDDTITDERGKQIAIVVDMINQPADDVVVTFATTNALEGTTAITTLTFTHSTYSNDQTITVTGQDDPGAGVDDGPITYSILFAANVSNDVNYNGRVPIPIVLVNLDDDVQANGCVMPESPIQEDSGLQTVHPCGSDTDVGGLGIFDISLAGITQGQGLVSNPQVFNTLSFSPAPNFYGNVEITYTIVNEWGDTSTAKSTLVVVNVPDKPVAAADFSWPTQENTFIDFDDVVWNDDDVDNLPPTSPSLGLTIASITATGGGAVVINGGKGFRFTPYPNWNSTRNAGAFTVTYRVRDPEGNISDNEVTIPITVTPINAPPNANGRDGEDDAEATEGEAFSFSTFDNGGDGDEYANHVLTYEVVNAPSHGTVAADGLGGWVYTPKPDELDYNGTDTFDYRVRDDDQAGPIAELLSSLENVSLVIGAINDPPIGFEQLDASTNEDTPLDLVLAGNDGDPLMSEVQSLTFAIVSEPTNGSITSFNPSTGQVTYEPAPNYNNKDDDYDLIGFTVTDDDTCGGGPLTSQVVYVRIRVNPGNDLPDAVADSTLIGVPPGGFPPPKTLDVLANDTDIDFEHEGDVHAVQSVTDGTYGTVAISGTSVTYTPNGTYTLLDTFTYTLVDSGGGTDTTTVTVSFSWSPALTAARPATVATPSGVVFANDEEFDLAVAPIVREAAARWAAMGIDTSALSGARVKLADLDGALLGLDIAGTILIDRDAAGFGWFVDATPRNDREFRLRDGELVARRDSDAAGRMDLLTAVMHEMGHLLRADHSDESNDLMFDTLDAGVRRNPDRDDLALGLAIDQSVSKRRSRAAADEFFAELQSL